MNTNEGLESMTRASQSATSIPSSIYRQVSDFLITPRVLRRQDRGEITLRYIKKTSTVCAACEVEGVELCFVIGRSRVQIPAPRIFQFLFFSVSTQQQTYLVKVGHDHFNTLSNYLFSSDPII